MVKKSLIILTLLCVTPFFCACEKAGIVTSTGKMGHRADNYRKYLPVSNAKSAPQTKGNVIYLGREYENNHFGPAGIKFVFER